MFQPLITQLRGLSDLLDFFLASILLTVLFAMTKKGWSGIKNILLALIGTTITGYLFAEAVSRAFPSVYSFGERFGNTVSSVGVFLILMYLLEKDTYKEIFTAVKNKFISSQK